MEKTLTIDGKQVRFKSTGATPLRYKAQFRREYFKEILKMNSLVKLQNKEPEELTPEDISQLDFEVLYNIVWVMAKTANKGIPEPMEWLDGFDEFPIVDIIIDLQDLLVSSMQQSKKN